MYCCIGFKNYVSRAGERGTTFVALEIPSIGICFAIQSRGVAFEDIDKLTPNPIFPDVPINLATEVCMKYCPFCGSRLEDMVRDSPKYFRELAKEHSKFVIHPELKA